MPMRDSDTILGATRGSADEALSFARNVGAKHLDQVEQYVREVYDLAPRIGIDPAIVVAQSALERAPATHLFLPYHLTSSQMFP